MEDGMNCLLFVIFSINFLFSSDEQHPVSSYEKLPEYPIFACGSIINAKLTVDPFSRIFASFGTISLDPTIEGGNVIISGEENVVEALSIATYGDTLYIRPFNPLWTILSLRLKISVGIANYSTLCLTGKGKYIFDNQLSVPQLNLELSGQASCKADCNVKELRVKMSDTADLVCTGKADQYELLMTGKSSSDLSKLQGRCAYYYIDKLAAATLSSSSGVQH
jgi:hypothetical protein